MKYKLYKKATGEDAGQVLAIVGEDETKVIDNFEVYTIANTSPIEMKTYKDEDIKINADGRALWSEITWREYKWNSINVDIDLSVVVAGLRSDTFMDVLSDLTIYFTNE